jgi:hypothetical protein
MVDATSSYNLLAVHMGVAFLVLGSYFVWAFLDCAMDDTTSTCRADLMMLVIGVDRKWPADSQDGAFDPGDIDPIRPPCTISFAIMETRRDGYALDCAANEAPKYISRTSRRDEFSAG